MIVTRLFPGSDLLEALTEIARRESIRSGVILSGAASLSEVILRNVRGLPPQLPITDEDRVFVHKKGPYELLSISGNISEQDGDIWVHAHITVSSGEEDGLAYGGHLVVGCKVLSLAELVLAEIEGVRLARTYDKATRGPQLHIVSEDMS